MVACSFLSIIMLQLLPSDDPLPPRMWAKRLHRLLLTFTDIFFLLHGFVTDYEKERKSGKANLGGRKAILRKGRAERFINIMEYFQRNKAVAMSRLEVFFGIGALVMAMAGESLDRRGNLTV